MKERNQFTEKQAAWLSALESGEYPQVRDNLCFKGGYCCLGVATAIVDPDHYALKHNGWDREDYIDDYEYEYLNELGDDESTAPPEAVEALDLSDTSGGFRFGFRFNEQGSLVALNDKAGMTFPQIAEFIRSHPWAVFKNFDQPRPEAPEASQ